MLRLTLSLTRFHQGPKRRLIQERFLAELHRRRGGEVLLAAINRFITNHEVIERDGKEPLRAV